MHVPRRALPLLWCLLCVLVSSGADAGIRVLREAKTPNGNHTLQWLGAPDGTCTGMRLLDGKAPTPALVRYATECSRIDHPFSPDGQTALFMSDPAGPIHVVSTRTLAAYLRGEVMADRVVYPSDMPGMPPSPARLVEFLGWRSDDVFELSGARCGGASRYSYIISQGRILETCHKDALRPQCVHASPDGAQVVLLTSAGFHVVRQARLGAFLVGNAQSTFIPSDTWSGVIRPVFLGWSASGDVLMQGEAEDQPHHFSLNVTTGNVTRGARIDWDWQRDLP